MNKEMKMADEMTVEEYVEKVHMLFPLHDGNMEGSSLVVELAQDGSAKLLVDDVVKVEYTGGNRIIENAYYEGKIPADAAVKLKLHLESLDQEMNDAEAYFAGAEAFRLGHDPVPDWFKHVTIGQHFVQEFFTPGNWILPKVGGSVVSIKDEDYKGVRKPAHKRFVDLYHDIYGQDDGHIIAEMEEFTHNDKDTIVVYVGSLPLISNIMSVVEDSWDD